MDICSGTGQNLFVCSSDFTKDVVVVEAFVGLVTLDFVSSDVWKSFWDSDHVDDVTSLVSYTNDVTGSELDVKYVGLLAFVVAGWVMPGEIISIVHGRRGSTASGNACPWLLMPLA